MLSAECCRSHNTEEGSQVANKPVKRCSTPLTIRERKLNAQRDIRMAEMKMATPNAGVDVGKLNHSPRAGDNGKGHSLSGKQGDSFLQTKRTTTIHPATPLWAFSPEKRRPTRTHNLYTDGGSGFGHTSPKLDNPQVLQQWNGYTDCDTSASWELTSDSKY